MGGLHSILRKLLPAALAILCTAPAMAAQHIAHVEPQATYTNRASHFWFPPEIAGFRREAKVTEFDDAGRDMGVGYNELTNGIAATVFVYPMVKDPPDNTLEGHFASCKAAAMNPFADAKLISEGKCEINSGAQKHAGWHASFTCTRDFGGKKQRVRSQIYLFTKDRNFVLYRFTYPATEGKNAEEAVQRFVNTLEWPK